MKVGYLDQSDNKKEELTKDYVQDDSELEEIIFDELHELDEVFSYGEFLLILGLYRVVELTSKNIFKKYSSISNGQRLTSINSQKDIFNNITSKKLEDLTNFKSIDELRQLNNCIKHSGKVDKNLSKDFPRWEKGEEIKNVLETYERLKPRVPEYLFNLSKTLANATN